MQKAKLLVLCLFMVLSHGALAQAQQSKAPTLWKVFISVGYADATSSNLNDYYNLIVDSYRSSGIPIPTQVPFGRTALVNGGFLFTRLEHVWIGLCAGFTYSPSYSNYEDYAGTLKINGLINSYEVSLKIKATVSKIGDFPVVVSAQPGVSYVTTSITQDLRLSNFSAQNYDLKWSSFAWGPFLLGSLGTSIDVGIFMISPDVGYKLSWNKIYELGLGNQRIYGPWNIGPSGVLFLLSFEKQL
jgi:hypothetical protein